VFVEISIVIEARQGPEGLRDLDHPVSRAAIDLVAVDPQQARILYPVSLIPNPGPESRIREPGPQPVRGASVKSPGTSVKKNRFVIRDDPGFGFRIRK
jgi:hypothetical protein